MKVAIIIAQSLQKLYLLHCNIFFHSFHFILLSGIYIYDGRFLVEIASRIFNPAFIEHALIVYMVLSGKLCCKY